MATVVMTRSQKRRSLSLMSFATSSTDSPIPTPLTRPVPAFEAEDQVPEQPISAIRQIKEVKRQLSPPTRLSPSPALTHHRKSTSWPASLLPIENPQQEYKYPKSEDELDYPDPPFNKHRDDPNSDDKRSKTVDDRVLAMLAATASLKPPPVTPSTVLGSSILLKVTSAIDRIYARPSRCSSRVSRTKLHKQPHPFLAAVPRREPPHEDQQPGPSHITTIEMRLNEGNNLNRRKVQRIVGGSLSRKPVPGQGQAGLPKLTNSPGLDEPHGTPDQGLGSRTTSIEIASNTHFKDPFISEQNFEDDLIHGFLSTSPAASSSPKSKISSGHNRRNNISKEPLENRRLFIYKDFDHGAQTVEPQHKTTPGRPGDVFLDPSTSCSATPKFRSTALKDSKRAKKHPSPSKNALEDLEAAFTKYVHMRGHGQADDVDELATDYQIMPAFLVAQDPNRLIGKSLGRRMQCPGTRERSPLGRNGDTSKVSLKRAFPYLEHSDPSCETDELQL